MICNPDFKCTPLFNVEYLRWRHIYSGMLKGSVVVVVATAAAVLVDIHYFSEYFDIYFCCHNYVITVLEV